MSPLDHARDFDTYAMFRPTGFDVAGLGLEDRQDWKVFPVSTNRDADAATETNWDAALAMLQEADPEGEHHETHTFGHWSNGWFEIVLLDPAHEPTMVAAGEIVCRLADYPILDDDAFSMREEEDAQSSWGEWAHRDFVGAVCGAFALSDAARDLLEDAPDECWTWHMAHSPYGYETNSDGSSFSFGYIRHSTEPNAVARLLKTARRIGGVSL